MGGNNYLFRPIQIESYKWDVALINSNVISKMPLTRSQDSKLYKYTIDSVRCIRFGLDFGENTRAHNYYFQ